MVFMRSAICKKSISDLFRRSVLRFSISTNGESDICINKSRKPGIYERIHVIDSHADWESAFKDLSRTLQRFPVMGFDCEWPSNPLIDWSLADTDEKLAALEYTVKKMRKRRFKISLLQLATSDGTVALVRICRLESVPESLRTLLSDSNILKVGVESALDGRRLSKDYPEYFPSIKGIVDIRYLLPSGVVPISTRPDLWSKYLSLNGLCGHYLNICPEKKIRITCSDWSAPVLTPEQVQYAATDAQISIDVFMAILKEAGFQAHDGQWEKIYEFCRPHLDEIYRMPKSSTRKRRLHVLKIAMDTCLDKPGKEKDALNSSTVIEKV